MIYYVCNSVKHLKNDFEKKSFKDDNFINFYLCHQEVTESKYLIYDFLCIFL